MSRYDRMFAGGQRNDGVFGGFLMLGDPDLETSAKLLDAMVEGGADMIEVGIPFSDPVADGPVIQAAAKRALALGITVNDCFQLIAGFRERHPDVPVGILTYANLVLSPGRQEFFRRAADSGADSLLIADLPAREAAPWAREMMDVGLDPVLIAAANTPKEVLGEIARIGRGYTYCVTRVGITGVHAAGTFDTRLLDDLKLVGAPPPVFGFGISKPEHVAAAMRAGASGVISGSAIVACLEQPDPVAAVRTLVASLKAATRNDSAAS
jgi:tryptophan synthase alpha chain